MRDRVDEAPIVQCPGCHQPMEPKERTSVTERLVDIRYVRAACGMETKRRHQPPGRRGRSSGSALAAVASRPQGGARPLGSRRRWLEGGLQCRGLTISARIAAGRDGLPPPM